MSLFLHFILYAINAKYSSKYFDDIPLCLIVYLAICEWI